jgi:flagellar basal-body rod modification protein FlgD
VAVDAVHTSAAPAAGASPASGLGRDQFVRLLMTQLSHQDPLSPMNGEAFVAQLAQFATLELQQQQVSTLESLLVAQTAAGQTQIAGLVGKDVVYRSDAVHLAAGGTAAIRGKLGADAEAVTVTILDAQGRTVRTLQLPPHAAGDVEVTWDGLDAKGQPVPAGQYQVRITAADARGASVEAESRAAGKAAAVSFENGYAELVVNGVRVKLADVLEVREPAPPPVPN